MLSAAARARLTVVLVGARNPQNIGAAARAMQDFGFSDLRLVNDFAASFEAAQLEAAQLESTAAVAAHAVMQSARRFDTLATAIADCTLIVGTTAIGVRELTQPIEPLQHTAPRIIEALSAITSPGGPSFPATSERVGSKPPSPAAHAASDTSSSPSSLLSPLPPDSPPRVALLFGSEKTGLTNDHLSHCQLLTTIPLFAPEDARHLSMNLGQSVAVCLYELTRAGFEHSIEIPVANEPPATADDRERLTQLLLDVMHATGYTRRFPANAAEPTVRQLTQQLGTTHREAMTWMGILRQILWRKGVEDKE